MDPLRRSVADLAALVAARTEQGWAGTSRRFASALRAPQLHSDTVMELVVDVVVLDHDAELGPEVRSVVFTLVEVLMCAGEWSQLTAVAQVLTALSIQDGIVDEWRAAAGHWMGMAISPLTVSNACEHLPVLHPARQPWLAEFVAHYTNHPSRSFGRLHFLPMSAESRALLLQVLAALGLQHPDQLGPGAETPAGMATRALDNVVPAFSPSPP